MTARLGILLSGRGSNFLAIHEAILRKELPAGIIVVIANRPDSPGLLRARDLGYEALTIDEKDFGSRIDHETAILGELRDRRVEIVCLAGYMRKLTAHFVEAYPLRILNIHPSLLPAFPGVDAQAQALSHGVKVSGCTVHLVDASLDGGPILVQRAVDVLPDDTLDSLSSRILIEEHIAYVEAIAMLLEGVRVEGRRVIPDRDPLQGAPSAVKGSPPR